VIALQLEAGNWKPLCRLSNFVTLLESV